MGEETKWGKVLSINPIRSNIPNISSITND
jgi:hypothetical protein